MNPRGFPHPILPPFILSAIARNGSPQERDSALRTLSLDSTLRSARAADFCLTPHLRQLGATTGQKRRTIYDARGTQQLPGQPVRQEGDGPSKDVAVNEAYEGLGATYDFFSSVYGRNSIDDKGLALLATVHFGKQYNNAFWNGDQMVFGDGDGRLFNRFTLSLDVIGHELAHGVTQSEANLDYFMQPGALNESVSDVFGSLVKQYRLGQTAEQADWLIGEGLFTPKVKGVALRSMKAPGTAFDDPVLGKDPQPADMKGYVDTLSDNGGVHINSGIPNRAFYLAAVGIGGFAWEKAGCIWYETLRDKRLANNANFSQFAALTVENAAKLYGAHSPEEKAVLEGWQVVGVELRLEG